MNRMKRTLSAARPDGAELKFFNQDMVDVDENETSKMQKMAPQNDQSHRGLPKSPSPNLETDGR